MRHGIDLLALPDAAKNDGVTQAEMAAVRLAGVADLNGKLARRRQDKNAHTFRRKRDLVGGEVVQNWQAERGCLSGAGLRDAKNVATLHDDGNGAGLNGGGGFVIFLTQSSEDRLGKTEIRE